MGRADQRTAVTSSKVEDDRAIGGREAVELTDVDVGELPAGQGAHVAQFTERFQAGAFDGAASGPSYFLFGCLSRR